MNLILASGSPRRKELLSLYTTDFTICVSDFDDEPESLHSPNSGPAGGKAGPGPMPR